MSKGIILLRLNVPELSMELASVRMFPFVKPVRWTHILMNWEAVSVFLVQNTTVHCQLVQHLLKNACVSDTHTHICQNMCQLLILCSARPLLLDCGASNIDDHVTIDCKTNRPPQITLCTFNDGLVHPCK